MNFKKLLPLFFAALLPICVFSFEGIVTFEMENKEIGEIALVEWQTKNGNHLLKYSTSFEEGNYDYQLLIQSGKQEMLMLTEVHGEKELTRIPLQLIEMQNASWVVATVQKTERQKDFAGFTADSYKITSPTGYAICYVSSHPKLRSLVLPPALSSGGVSRALSENNIEGAILFMEVFDLDGNLKFSQTTIEIQSMSLYNRTFEIPSGY